MSPSEPALRHCACPGHIDGATVLGLTLSGLRTLHPLQNMGKSTLELRNLAPVLFKIVSARKQLVMCFQFTRAQAITIIISTIGLHVAPTQSTTTATAELTTITLIPTESSTITGGNRRSVSVKRSRIGLARSKGAISMRMRHAESQNWMLRALC